jgi:hypothetical protein
MRTSTNIASRPMLRGSGPPSLFRSSSLIARWGLTTSPKTDLVPFHNLLSVEVRKPLRPLLRWTSGGPVSMIQCSQLSFCALGQNLDLKVAFARVQQARAVTSRDKRPVATHCRFQLVGDCGAPKSREPVRIRCEDSREFQARSSAGFRFAFAVAGCWARAIAAINPGKRWSISGQRDVLCISTARHSLRINPASRNALK